MTENPYQPINEAPAAGKAGPTNWLVWIGAVALILAVVCLGATVVGMNMVFDSMQNSTPTDSPSDAAVSISGALLPVMVAAPLGLLGIILIIVGLVRRKTTSQHP